MKDFPQDHILTLFRGNCQHEEVDIKGKEEFSLAQKRHPMRSEIYKNFIIQQRINRFDESCVQSEKIKSRSLHFIPSTAFIVTVFLKEYQMKVSGKIFHFTLSSNSVENINSRLIRITDDLMVLVVLYEKFWKRTLAILQLQITYKPAQSNKDKHR